MSTKNGTMNYLEKELRTLIKNDPSIFDFLQQSALDGLWYWDLTDPDHEWMNPTFWEVLGYDPDSKEHTPASWMNIIHPEDLKIAQKSVEQHLANPDKPYDQITRYTHAEGHQVWIRCRGLALRDETGRPIRMLGAHTDVSEVKKKEELLERCNSISGIGYWEVNYKEYTVEWSPTTKAIQEVSESYVPTIDNLLGNFADEIHHELVRDSIELAISEKSEQKVTALLTTAEKTEKWVDILIIPIIKDNECVKLYGTIHDIDRRKRAQMEIDRLLKKTRSQNDRLLNFTNTVSHNLRSQVGGVASLIELIELDKPELAEHELFKYLKMASEKLANTVVHLSDVAIGMDFKDSDFKSIPLKEMVDENIPSIINIEDRDDFRLINNIPEELMIDAIPVYLESILFNLISNAFKYADPEKESVIELNGGYNKHGWTWFSVTDNGLGIDLNKYGDKLFGMYKTFHDHEDSRGVGLFLIRNQIDTMDGNIHVESEPGKGTTFRVEFPVRNQNMVQA